MGYAVTVGKDSDLVGKQPAHIFSIFAIVAAFSSYFSMYAFRKPFAAGSYAEIEAVTILGATLQYKTILIISQVIGYCLSKFMGIKIISEMPASRRALSIALCIGIAWSALLLFAVIPAPYNILCLFINGLPLGMIWGLVFGFLEGRKVSEVLGVGLSASYILASGVVKSVGKILMNAGVPEFWMPFATGACFAIPMAVFVFLLASLPPPTPEDIAERTERKPMDAEARKAFFMRYLPGLLSLTVLYILLTAYRDFRDNFAVEIWKALGKNEQESAALLAGSELPVTVGVLLVLAFLMFIKDNRKALLAVHVIMLLGTATVGLSTLLFSMDIIGPTSWMILIGFGLYAAYVPFGCILFDRLNCDGECGGNCRLSDLRHRCIRLFGLGGIDALQRYWESRFILARILQGRQLRDRHLLYRTLPGITALLLALTTVRKVAETSIALQVGC